jgi:hypothetical protein
MATTVESMVDSFPHANVPPIVGTPTYETMATLFRLLCANATSVPCALGNGALGWLRICIDDALFNTFSNVPFPLPTNPGYAPVIPNFAAQSTIAAMQADHKEQLRLWNEYNTVDRALKQQLIGAIEDKYLSAIRNRLTGFSTQTTREIMQHLLRHYGRITPAEINDNDAKFRKEFDGNEPIEVLFEQIEDAMQFAVDAVAPYNVQQVLANALNLVQRTGVYEHAVREWRRLPTPDHTWSNFKHHFADAATDLRDDRRTSNQSGYHAANNALEAFTNDTAEAFANLANATVADRSMMADLMATNKELLDQLKHKDSELMTLRMQLMRRPAAPTPTGPAPTGGAARVKKRYKNENYCWSHGYDVSKAHTSESCTFPKDGHNTSATRTHNLGGSQLHKDRTT